MAWLTTDNESWIDSVEGNVPLLLTFTHAGTERINAMMLADGGTYRKDPGLGGTFNINHDTRTREVAEAILEYLDWSGGFVPYIIIPLVKRIDLDLNRGWEHNRKGYELGGAPSAAVVQAQKIYDAYYAAIFTFINKIQTDFSPAISDKAFHIDFHGMGLEGDIDIELGSRGGRAADKPLVYGGVGVSLALIDAIKDQGYRFHPDADQQTRLEGGEVLTRAGLDKGGLQAVQVEMDSKIRGSGESIYAEKVRVARLNGRKIGIALEQLIKKNGYPLPDAPTTLSIDDDHFILM